MPTVSLRRYLNGKRHIDVAVLHAICDAMGLDPQWVVAQASERLTGRRVDVAFPNPATPEAIEAWLADDDTPAAAAERTRPGSRKHKDD